MKNIIELALSKILKSESFTKKGSTWFKTLPESILVINLQKSQFSDRYYVNLGVWVKQFGVAQFPKIQQCHIQMRLESISDQELARHLDLEELSIGETDRLRAIETSVRENGLPWLFSNSEITKIREEFANGRLKNAGVRKEVAKLLADGH